MAYQYKISNQKHQTNSRHQKNHNNNRKIETHTKKLRKNQIKKIFRNVDRISQPNEAQRRNFS